MATSESAGIDASEVGPPISVKEAAELLGVSADTIRAHLRQGTLPGEKIKNAWVVYLDAPRSASASDSAAEDRVLMEGPVGLADEARSARPRRQARRLATRAGALVHRLQQRLTRR